MAGQPRPALGEGLILTLNARPLFQLKAGPLRFLLGLRKLAGRSRSFETLTCSLAKLFGRCVNTIRTWRNELVEQGYIHWILDRRTGRVTIFVRMAVEPPSRHEELDKLEQRKPGQGTKKSWWKRPNSKPWGRGTQFPEPIKIQKIREQGRGLSSLIQAPIRTVEEQLRLLLETKS